ncbi:GNAT family protein [Mucilaginibacter sp.]|uniref:GNAT family N-acetyltransferase n=1 Tax=Mucilaginibacter sp. TaxID=1882438 RepID=UPI0025CF3868|nr:GNAT family protein [Mucilaginibacter sp.]
MPVKFPSTQFPELHTHRLRLRELMFSDTQQLLAIRSNDDINRFIGRSSVQTAEAVNQFIAARRKDMIDKRSVYWGIELKCSGKLIGAICYWNLNDKAISAEIGYELLPSEQGKGLMKEAVDSVIAYGFDEMELNTITAWLSPANVKSVQLLERHHFSYNETIDKQLVYKLSRLTWQTGML